jgi:hypothetical protein
MPSKVTSAAVQAAVDVPVLTEGASCRAVGSCRVDPSSGVLWQTPGAVVFEISIPRSASEEPLSPESFDVTVIAEPLGRRVQCGTFSPSAVRQEESKLYLQVKCSVLAPFGTEGQIALAVEEKVDGKYQSIGEVRFNGRFE